MQPLKVVILGSCVTRDVFRIFPSDVRIIDYFARTCVPSLVTEPLYVEDSEVNLGSEFQKRMVLRDLRKSFWTDIPRLDYDVLLLDLVDERFDMVGVGRSIINKTGELDSSGYLNGKPSSVIKKPSYGMDAWKRDCATFVRMLRQEVDINKVRVIRARWAEDFLDKDGQVKKLDDKNLQLSIRMNSTVGGYYDELQRLLPECPVISSPRNIASASHLWGLGPIHYVDDWYKDIKEGVMKLSGWN